MPIPIPYIQAADRVQENAANSPNPQVRLIAGPGTGKSSAIEKRVCWLLNQGVPTNEIYAVSFTRASAKELQERINDHCQTHGHAAAGNVRVSTLHSLALRILRAAGLLARYAVDPLVLDNWELEEIFEAEFGQAANIRSKERREQIRYYYEAHWSTGLWNPPNYLPPDPPITDAEANQFVAFQQPRTQLYSCVLPGEIVRQCVQEIAAGVIDPVALLHVQHLIVDEFQDLNPMDLDLVYSLIERGIVTFVAGDDDQSIYFFRFAAPSGIQDFPTRYPTTAQHTLDDCFRCMPEILATANHLIYAFPPVNRIPKHSVSLYRHSNPPAPGVVHRWRFADGMQEADSIAASCEDLIDAGIEPRHILILLNNQRALGRSICASLEGRHVPFEPPRIGGFVDSKVGRLVLAVLRTVCNGQDYIAHRTILGIRSGVGVGTCNAIAQAAIDNNLNFHNLFYRPLPQHVFSTRGVNALTHARDVCTQVSNWQSADRLDQRRAEVTAIATETLSAAEAHLWDAFADQLPPEMTLEEVRDFMWADNDEQQAIIMQGVYTRLGQAVPAAHLLPQRVRLMTMHGSKGLSARVVFIPGLEDDLIPGPWRVPYPGLVLEAARLLYVSITRARAACILSFAGRRFINGRMQWQAVSRFNANLNGVFAARMEGLTDVEVNEILQNCGQID
jgi:DNA helicase II / ATP-dependent DNA helicase PcrA